MDLSELMNVVVSDLGCISHPEDNGISVVCRNDENCSTSSV